MSDTHSQQIIDHAHGWAGELVNSFADLTIGQRQELSSLLIKLADQLHKNEWAHEQCLPFLEVHGWDWKRVMEGYSND